MNTLLLNISDIHIGLKTIENEGVVIDAFITDVEKQISSLRYDDVFVIIGGDLVQSPSESSYLKFDESIVQKLIDILKIDRKHFIIVPGNHDLSQNHVKEISDSFLPIFTEKKNESEFNDWINKKAQYSVIFGKFNDFKKYTIEKFGYTDKVLTCEKYELNKDWSIHTLNTAILSCGGYNNIDDANHLGIDTRTLSENIRSDKHPHKILLMHHPDYFCMDWVKHELKKFYGSDFDLVLSGHTHDQDLLCHSQKNYIHCEAPQLFSDKNDSLGYCFIELNENGPHKIKYREWMEKRNKFRPGSAFTDDDSGEQILEKESKSNAENDDFILRRRESILRDAMEAFIGQPYIWIDRNLSDDRIDQLFKFNKSTIYTETDIINNAENIKIVAPSQYGLTCYAHHFLLTLWKTKKEFGIYIDANNTKCDQFESYVKKELKEYQKNESDVKWIIIDNWRPFKKDQKLISNYLSQKFPHSKIVLMSPFSERDFNNHDFLSEHLSISKTLYLTPLKHEQERLIVDEYNKIKYIDESDEVLLKLDNDIKDFNLHRTPYNCITLLTVFKDSFDKSPVNRTSLLENVLNIIFDNTKLPNYRNQNPDIKDCEFCLGYFCSKLIEKESHNFSKDEFYKSINDFCNLKKTRIDIMQLFEVLCFNKIIIESNNTYYFRFSFWVYYFVASWMHVDSDYAEGMIKDKKYQHFPDVLEFYTGKDRKRNDAVLSVTADLNEIVNNIQQKIGTNKNPFSFLRMNHDSSKSDQIIKQIEDTVNQSNIPQSIKDEACDLSFNPSAAFHQQINRVYSDFSVGKLVNIISIASKVLRNSDYLDANLKQNLLEEILNGLKVFSNIIFLVSHLFAKQGYITLPEYKLKLSDDFNKYDESKKRIEIIVAIPYNLVLMFKNDLFSRKLSPIYIEHLEKENDYTKKHILASFVVSSQPDGWETAIKKYISFVDKDSYYLGTLSDLMLGIYNIGDVKDSDRRKMSTLIKSAIYKAGNKKGLMPNSINQIRDKKISPNVDITNSSVDTTNDN